MAAIAMKLAETLGLNAESLGDDALDRAVCFRMQARGIADPASYAHCIDVDGEERARLTEELTVPETWFFRHAEAFVYLESFIRQCAAERPSLRILSMPCSTGEELYSIALMLRRADWPLSRSELLGVDINASSLQLARRGQYGKNSFRGSAETLRAIRRDGFEAVGDCWQIEEDLRQAVTWRRGNAMDKSFTDGLGTFDVLFCRNLMIYLTSEARDRLSERLARMLSPGGVLFLGAGEQPDRTLFQPVPHPSAFAWTFIDDSSRPSSQPPEPRTTGRPHERTLTAPPDDPPPPAQPAEAVDPLASAQQAADAGHLDQAAEMCRTLLRRKPDHVRVIFLLGMVLDALGDNAAAKVQYEKVLYLQPEHAEALHCLALLSERLGDRRAADSARRRLQRLHPANAPDRS